MWHLLTHTCGLTYGFHYAHPSTASTATTATSSARRTRPRQATEVACLPCSSSPAPVQLLRLHRRPRPGDRGPLRAAARRLPQRAHPRPARDVRHRVRRRRPRPAGRALTPAWCATTAWAPARLRRVPLGRRRVIGTAADYHRFRACCSAGASSTAPPARTRTLRFMGRDRLPGGAELKDVARPTISETQNDGMGFGLGFSVVLDAADQDRRRGASSPGAGWPAPRSGSIRRSGSRALLHAADASSTYPLRSQLASSPTRRWWTDAPKLVGVPARTRASAPS